MSRINADTNADDSSSPNDQPENGYNEKLEDAMIQLQWSQRFVASLQSRGGSNECPSEQAANKVERPQTVYAPMMRFPHEWIGATPVERDTSYSPRKEAYAIQKSCELHAAQLDVALLHLQDKQRQEKVERFRGRQKRQERRRRKAAAAAAAHRHASQAHNRGQPVKKPEPCVKEEAPEEVNKHSSDDELSDDDELVFEISRRRPCPLY